jgi:hypothetical protein
MRDVAELGIAGRDRDIIGSITIAARLCPAALVQSRKRGEKQNAEKVSF